MKKKLLLLLVATQIISASNTIEEALSNGTYSTNMRVFYFDRSFDVSGKENATALTIGGILKYESAELNGFKVGFAYYGSHRIGGFFSRAQGAGTSILKRSTGEDINFLGEAYVEYKQNNTVFTIGRQQLSTSLIRGHDLRLLPSVYEAAVIKNTDLDKTLLEAGYVQAYSGFTSKDSAFLDQNSKWGEDGLAYLYFTNSSLKDIEIRAQYVYALSDKSNSGDSIKIEDYKYLDLKYLLPYGEKSYLKMQFGGNKYSIGDDSLLYGAKVGTSVGIWDFALLYDKVESNAFKAVESGPMYSDWQQGYGPYEPSSAVGGQIIVHPIPDLSVKVGHVQVDADKDFRADGTFTDDFSESYTDIKYKLTSNSKMRVRYSIKNQSSESDREDRDDFRVIYYLNF